MLQQNVEILAMSRLEVGVSFSGLRFRSTLVEEGERHNVLKVRTRYSHTIGCAQYCIGVEPVLALNTGKDIDVTVIGNDRACRGEISVWIKRHVESTVIIGS